MSRNSSNHRANTSRRRSAAKLLSSTLNSRQNISSFQELYHSPEMTVIHGSKNKIHAPTQENVHPHAAYAMAYTTPTPVDIPRYGLRPDQFPPHPAALKIHAMPAQLKLPTLSPAQEKDGIRSWNTFVRKIDLTPARICT